MTSTKDEDDDMDMIYEQNEQKTKEKQLQLTKFKEELSQQPNNYTSHFNVVNTLYELHPNESTKEFIQARSLMLEKFPIPPEIFLKYIQNEINSVSNSNDIKLIINLFELNIFDYISYDIWINYITFILKYKNEINNSIKLIKNVFKNAQKTICYHFNNGNIFWELWREYETDVVLKNIIENYKKDPDATPECDGDKTPENINEDSDVDGDKGDDDDDVNNAIRKQVEYIRGIWKEQIKNVPHKNIEQTYREYQQWECKMYDEPNTEMKKDYEKMKKITKIMLEYENKRIKLPKIASPGYADSSILEYWLDYISNMIKLLNKKQISKFVICNLYERAINDCFLYETIWLEYINFLKNNKFTKILNDICLRSIRNVMNSSKLMVKVIQCIGCCDIKYKDKIDKLFNIFKNGQWGDNNNCLYLFDRYNDYLAIGIEFCHYYRQVTGYCADIHYNYPKLALNGITEDNTQPFIPLSKCEEIFDEIEILISNSTHTQYINTFYEMYIDLLGRHMNKIKKGRDLCEKFLKLRSYDYNAWHFVIEWEKQFGIFNSVSPSKRKIGTSNEIFKKSSDFDNIKHGWKNIYRIRLLYSRAIDQIKNDIGLQFICNQYKKFERKIGDFRMYLNVEKIVNDKLSKIQSFRGKRDRYENKENNNNKKSKNNENKQNKKRKRNEKDSETSLKPTKKQKTTPNKTEKDEISQEIKQENENKINNKDERTVFILNFNKKCKKEQLKELLLKYGEIESIILPKQSKKSKNSKELIYTGRGFIIYKKKEYAIECIKKLNGIIFQNRKLTVQKYISKRNNNNTIFIKGLKQLFKQKNIIPENIIKNIFKECGNIIECRFPSFENGDIKGFAYVEFENEDGKKKALELNNKEYDGVIVEVSEYSEGKKPVRQVKKEGKMHKRMKLDGDDRKNSINKGEKVDSKPKSNSYFANLFK